MENLKNWILKNHKRAWISGLAGMGLGWVVEIVASIWTKTEPLNGFVMLAIILIGAIVSWYVLTNNKDFKK